MIFSGTATPITSGGRYFRLIRNKNAELFNNGHPRIGNSTSGVAILENMHKCYRKILCNQLVRRVIFFATNGQYTTVFSPGCLLFDCFKTTALGSLFNHMIFLDIAHMVPRVARGEAVRRPGCHLERYNENIWIAVKERKKM